MKKKIKKVTPKPILQAYYTIKSKVKIITHLCCGYFQNQELYEGYRKPLVLLIGTPEHDNLGDHAIATAAEEMIRKSLPEYNFIEISVESYFKHHLCL